jgi:hypothetical protein
VKSGKKLLWSRGVSNSQTKSPVTTPSPKASVSALPTSMASPSAIPEGAQANDNWIPRGNPVTSAIEKRVSSIRKPIEVTYELEVLAENSVSREAIKSLEDQHRFMARAFPDALKGTKTRYFLYSTIGWAKDRSKEYKCNFPEYLEAMALNPVTMHAGATNCGDSETNRYEVAFINWPSFEKFDPATNRRTTGLDMFAFIAGQESSGGRVQFFYNASRELNNYNPLPAWYEQGGQFALSSIALAVETRKWRQSSLSQGSVYVCQNAGKLVTLKETSFYDAPQEANGCWYSSGAIATELMVALYGFDAPVEWYKKIKIEGQQSKQVISQTWETSFKATFGDSLSKFYEFADSYATYLKSNRLDSLSSELLSRLKQAG